MTPQAASVSLNICIVLRQYEMRIDTESCTEKYMYIAQYYFKAKSRKNIDRPGNDSD